jgi:hypothetical protein
MGGDTFNVDFYNLYIEGNGRVDHKAPLVYIGQNVGPVNFYGCMFNTYEGTLHSDKYAFENHGVELSISGACTVFNTTLGINDVTAAKTVKIYNFGTSNLGMLSPYTTR